MGQELFVSGMEAYLILCFVAPVITWIVDDVLGVPKQNLKGE